MSDLFGGSGGAEKEIKKGRERALAQLQTVFGGPNEMLRLAPEFFKLLSSPELAGTPLGRGVGLQQALISEAMGGLEGKAFGGGAIPADVRSAVLESLGQSQAARGTYGSGTGDVELAGRFSGISEQIRQSRIASALSILSGTGAAGSVFPSATQALGIGAERAFRGAGVEMEAGMGLAGVEQQKSAALGRLLGTGLSFGLGALTGGLGALPGLGLGGGLGGALGGGLAFSGLAPGGLFGAGRSPFAAPRPYGQGELYSMLFGSPVGFTPLS